MFFNASILLNVYWRTRNKYASCIKFHCECSHAVFGQLVCAVRRRFVLEYWAGVHARHTLGTHARSYRRRDSGRHDKTKRCPCPSICVFLGHDSGLERRVRIWHSLFQYVHWNVTHIITLNACTRIIFAWDMSGFVHTLYMCCNVRISFCSRCRKDIWA